MTKHILRVDSSMRKYGSYSRKLVDTLVMQLNKKEQHIIKSRDLCEGIPFIDEQWIAANVTPINEHTPEKSKALLQSDSLIKELQ